MRRPDWIPSITQRRPRGSGDSPASRREHAAILLAIVTMIGIAVLFIATKGTGSLMPAPLASVHGGIEKCSTCHTQTGDGKVSWLKAFVGSDPHADSKACVTCHKMPDTAFNAHGTSLKTLERSTQRLLDLASQLPVPHTARLQNAAFPTEPIMAEGVACASCHQEHQGSGFKLSKVSNEQCRSCHVVKFDSFDGNHPKFDSYPFARRTRIVFDHASHFGKHYPELVKKEPNKRIPEACSTCHDSGADKRVMAVVPFEKTCSGCHLDQITGKERATGPKGVAFLSVPGLDVQTLKDKNAQIGEWPEASEAPLTPFMRVMIGRGDKGRALLKKISSLDLKDLSKANDGDIKAVTELVWEIKGLYHALISGKASDVLGDFNIGSGAKLSAGLVSDLTASIPRDVIASAQQEWLPNLGPEMANRPKPTDKKQSGIVREGSEQKLAAALSNDEFDRLERSAKRASTQPRNLQLAQSATPKKDAEPPAADPHPATDAQGRARLPLPSGTPRSIGERNKGTSDPSDEAPARSDAKEKPSEKAADKPAEAAPSGDKPQGGEPKADAAAKSAPSDPADQSDDLLNLTEEDQRALKSGGDGGGDKPATASKPDDAPKGADQPGATPAAPTEAAATDTAPSAPKAATPVMSIASDIDPESWAEYGGWYRQDFAIFYRPTGHKDKFIYTWLYLTGPQAPRGDKGPAAAVFDTLTSKDAQGTCTKCHSVDDIAAKGRLVNFSPISLEHKRGRFTSFVHEPHFNIMKDRGCLTCHEIETPATAAAPPPPTESSAADKDTSPYLRSYAQGDPHKFASNFTEMKKDLCQGCHTQNMARQDCSLCHKYHVDGVISPIINTKLPTQ